MRIVVASGKGGVGKSMLASSLLLLFNEKGETIGCDCDVDAPNLALWLGRKKFDKRFKVSSSKKAEINDNCINCGKCAEACRFDAIRYEGKYLVDELRCEGCGLCRLVCPHNAITIKEVKNAEIMISFEKPRVYMAQLYPGESGSGKIVSKLREIAEKDDYEYEIIDAAAGIGCPVIASLKNADIAVLVSEPSPSGIADLKRTVELCNQFGLDYYVVVNKWDINEKGTREIERYAGEKLIGRISYDKKVIDAIVNLRPVLDIDFKVKKEIIKIFERLWERL